LIQCSASVRTASSTTEALRELERSRPDVLVSDLGMPDEDGYELIKRIRAMEAVTNSKALPALALTAYARPDDRVRALTAGYHVHLSKPVDPEEFALVVSNLLGRA
jgi:CheY-like chemotaxis protein